MKRKNNGEIHIGDNSWITKEENGRQKVYAKDAAGNPIMGQDDDDDQPIILPAIRTPNTMKLAS